MNDTQRLDYLEDYGHGIESAWSEPLMKVQWWVDENWDFRLMRDNVREAIDAHEHMTQKGSR